MDTVYKTFRAEVKEIDKESGEIDMFIPVSSDSVDRDGEVIEPTAFKKTLPKFMKRPVLVSSHDYRDLTKQIGEWSKLKISDSGFDGKPKYYINEGNEEADWGFNLATKGMAAFSVGFIPKVWEDGDGEKAPRRTYKEVELLEISQVIVPSNRDAIQGVRAKAADPVVLELCDEIENELEEESEEEKLETTTKPEETDEFIRIPVRDCKVTATIDISKKEGISALYCGKEKQVRTYLFRKDHDWTMAKAKEWVKEHDSGKAIDETEVLLEEFEPKGAIPYKKTPLAPEGTDWNAAREVREAEVSDLKVMCAIVEGDPENKTSYKLPHHKASGDHACVWRAVAACAAVLMGARGGVDAPEASINGAKAHIAKHYADFDKGEPPWNKTVSQQELLDEIDYLRLLIKKAGMNEEAVDSLSTLLEVEEKTGAVLNKKNRDRLNQIRRLAQEVLDSAGGEEEEEKRSPGDSDINQEILNEVQNINL